MSTLEHHGDGHGSAPQGLFGKLKHLFFTYGWSTDHKMIGKQFLFTGLTYFILGGLLALGVRWQLAWPGSSVPIYGPVDGRSYNMLFTMHASVMIFFVIIPLLSGAFGNYLIPLQIGARDMAFPWLNALSYWLVPPAAVIVIASFFVKGGASGNGWTAYPPLSLQESFQTAGAQASFWNGQNMWLLGVIIIGFSSVFGSLNYVVTIIKMRAPGMTMMRMPLTVWSLFITAILALFSTPVLTGTLIMQLMDRALGTSFFNPGYLHPSDKEMYAAGGGQVLLWQHLFWFYSHPAVYLMVLPAMGMVSDILAVNSRKPIFGYKPMIYSMSSIAGLGFVVWAHHMFQSGMNPALGMTFMVSTMFIALPSAVKVFNWLGTLWRGSIIINTPMLFALAFVSMFIIGGLSGIFMATTPVDMYIHDTYFIVAHIHYVVFCGTVMAVFGGIFFWFPKMFGRMMNETLGRIHCILTFIFMNGVFGPMHIVGLGGQARRYASLEEQPTLWQMMPLNRMITICAICLGFSQLFFFYNFITSIFWGPKAVDNPWQANSLEWTDTPTPPGHGNFVGALPTVYRPPYEYNSPEVKEDWLPQSKNLGAAAPAAGE
ncbi:MAG: cbb3-type cytochrome c oxidase subunit I [Planctomycetota bacterium]